MNTLETTKTDIHSLLSILRFSRLSNLLQHWTGKWFPDSVWQKNWKV